MTDNNRRKPCKNCARVMTIQSHDMCGACNNAAKGLEPGSAEYIKAMAETKARVTAADFTGSGNRHTIKTKTISREKIKKVNSRTEEIPDIKKIAPTASRPAVAILIDERNKFQECVFILNKAIELLS